jgi:hypothetical protein
MNGHFSVQFPVVNPGTLTHGFNITCMEEKPYKHIHSKNLIYLFNIKFQVIEKNNDECAPYNYETAS